MRYIIETNGEKIGAGVLLEALMKAKSIYNQTGIKPTITDTFFNEHVEY